jgi:hypothetical protein
MIEKMISQNKAIINNKEPILEKRKTGAGIQKTMLTLSHYIPLCITVALRH